MVHTSVVEQRLRPCLGTFVAIRCEAVDASVARRAVEAAYAALQRVERLMHPARSGSDLAALRALGVGVCTLDPWTGDVLRAAAALYAASDGLFDPCTNDAVGRMCDVRVLPGDRVELVRPVAIDLGGIAKGFAVDRAVDALRAHGCTAGEVNAGGDLRVFGPCDTAVWIRAGRVHWRVPIRAAACAVSDAGAANRPREHRGHYRRDAQALEPSGRTWAAVIAPSAMWADALATYAMVCRGPAERRRLRRVLARHAAREFDASRAAAKRPGKKSPAGGPG